MGLWSFQAVLLPSIPDIQTGIHTKNVILWKIYFLSSKTTAVLLPDMKRRLSIFMPLHVSPVSLFGYFDDFKTDSS